jgi:hypothetical protein
MFNSHTISGSVGKAQAAVRQHAKQLIRDQSSEFLKSVKAQGEIALTGHLQETKPPELVEGVPEISEEEKQKIESQSKSYLAQLEAELARLRGQRTQEMNQWVKAQDQLMNPEPEEGAEKKPIIMPTSKPKGPNAAQAAVAAKQGSRETTKQRST